MKLALISFDGIDPRIIFDNETQLPHFHRFMDNSMYGTIQTPGHTIPSYIQTLTGLPYHETNFYWDVEGDKGFNRHRQTGYDFLWDFCDASMTLLNIPVLYPPENINGTMVSGMLAPDDVADTNLTADYEVQKKLNEMEYIHEVRADKIFDELGANDMFSLLCETMDTRLEAAEWLMNNRDNDLFYGVWTSTDRWFHRHHTDGVDYFKMYKKANDILSQLMKIIPDDVPKVFFCYDDKTEVLTKDGWKNFGEVNYNDKIATLSPSHKYSNDKLYRDESKMELEYQKPSHITYEDYDGKMYKLKTGIIDMVVTPNHKLFYSKRHRDGKYNKVTAEKSFGSPMQFKKDCIWNGEEKDKIRISIDDPIITKSELLKMYKNNNGNAKKLAINLNMDYGRLLSVLKRNDLWNNKRIQIDEEERNELVPFKGVREYDAKTFMEFLGIWLGDGTLYTDEKDAYEIMIRQDKKVHRDVYQRTKELFEDMGCNPQLQPKYIKIYDRTLCKYLQKFWKPKRVPTDLKQLSSPLLNKLYNGLVQSDGTKLENGSNIVNTSERLIGDIQEILLKTGRKGEINKMDVDKINSYDAQIESREIKATKDRYTIKASNTELKPVVDKQTRKRESTTEEWINYNGKIGCVTVPNGIIYVRRNGHPVWCGNSDHGFAHFPDDNPVHTGHMYKGWYAIQHPSLPAHKNDSMNIFDIFATTVNYLGCEQPSGTKGRIQFHREEQDEEVQDKLKDLGYME